MEREHERVVITRKGHDAAVIISPDDLAQLEEMLFVLSDDAYEVILTPPARA
ncbi:MAG TPA: type II toxin-antitoxin system prevent-host-death family antitoxin [Solirubrobacteraceae bacterium]|nr:type II toxin-antitoxin system prevent-host-death family antitoxin [Solirubrobacteraceae bacterium]